MERIEDAARRRWQAAPGADGRQKVIDTVTWR
jgi:hypothetical protein